jgi:hypothetical protein
MTWEPEFPQAIEWVLSTCDECRWHDHHPVYWWPLRNEKTRECLRCGTVTVIA